MLPHPLRLRSACREPRHPERIEKKFLQIVFFETIFAGGIIAPHDAGSPRTWSRHDVLRGGSERMTERELALRRSSTRSILPESEKPADKRASSTVLQALAYCKILERAKGLEPSTPTLARSCSTTELHPHPNWRRLSAGNGRAMPNAASECNSQRDPGLVG
jgi:hypothetical protein